MHRLGLGFGFAAMVGCQPPVATIDAPKHDATIDAAPPPWWTPQPGEVDNWDIQIAAPFDLTPTRTAYVLNMWDLVPREITIDYGDGSPVTVPQGVHKEEIYDLHAQRPRPVVICLVDTGAVNLSDPDAAKFPGFAASPPDDPAAPDPNSVIGWSSALPPNTRWLDIRPAARAIVAPIIEKRFQLASDIGCDAVIADHSDQFAILRANGMGMPGEGTGFSPRISSEEQLDWYWKTLAPFGHAREMSMGYRGATALVGSSDLVQNFDFALADSCGEHEDCDLWSDFQRFGAKAILALDLFRTVDMRGPGQFCLSQINANISDGIIKDVAMTSAYWFACGPSSPQPDAGT